MNHSKNRPKPLPSPAKRNQAVMVKLTTEERAIFERLSANERRPLGTTVALYAIRGAAMEAKR